MLFTSSAALDPLDTNEVSDVYMIDRDPDRDGMPSDWEGTFGLDPNVGTDAAGDADGDGLSNLTEYRESRHPRGSSVKYLAEGVANTFFSTRIALMNPGTVATTAVLRYMGANRGLTRSEIVTVGPRQRATVFLTGPTAAPDYSFSTVIESDHALVVDRTTTWDASGYGSHAEHALDAPSTSWFLAGGRDPRRLRAVLSAAESDPRDRPCRP